MCGFGGDNDIKTEQMIKTIEEMSIEMIMLNETNCKRSTKTKEKLRKNLGGVNEDVNMTTFDGKEQEITKNDYLSGAHYWQKFGNYLVMMSNQQKKRISWGNGAQ